MSSASESNEIAETATNDTDYDHPNDGCESPSEEDDKSKFDHKFSGWSVWLEPEITESLSAEMSYLRQACGGKECGVVPYTPHITLLYNIRPFELQLQQQQNATTRTDGEEATPSTTTSRPSDPKEMLQQCWDEFTQWRLKSDNVSMPPLTNTADTSVVEVDESAAAITVKFRYWYFQHSLKSDDNGKGFGCCIAHLIIDEKERWLEQLRHICRDAFGPDEWTTYIPHVSLVYAPESCEEFIGDHVLKRREEQRQQEAQQQEMMGSCSKETKIKEDNVSREQHQTVSAAPSDDAYSDVDGGVVPTSQSTNGHHRHWWQEPHTVSYLSLWSTTGRLEDWYCIAKIPISYMSDLF